MDPSSSYPFSYPFFFFFFLTFLKSCTGGELQWGHDRVHSDRRAGDRGREHSASGDLCQCPLLPHTWQAQPPHRDHSHVSWMRGLADWPLDGFKLRIVIGFVQRNSRVLFSCWWPWPLFKFTVAWNSQNFCDGWLCKGNDCREFF